MYYAVSRLVFEALEHHRDEAKSLQILVQKIRQRFGVAVRSGGFQGNGSGPTIYVATLHHDNQSIQRTLDSISDFCEDSGFGRVESEQSLIDFFDAEE